MTESVRRVLQRRARDLARAKDDGAAAVDAVDTLLFTLARERFAVETRYVREVVNLLDLTPVPCVPSFVAGIINVRGQIVSVLDIQDYLQLPGEGFADRNQVILLSESGMEFGILTSGVEGVRPMSMADLQPSPSAAAEGGSPAIRGVHPEGVVVLDGRELLRDTRVVVHDVV